MLATLPTAATPPSGFSVTNLLGALVFVLIFWLFQRWLRDRVSTRRRERWEHEEGRAPADPSGQQGGVDGSDRGDDSDGVEHPHPSGPDVPGPDASGPDDPTRR